jgi:hypothetical protein
MRRYRLMSDAPARTMRSLEEGPWDGGDSALDHWYRTIRDVPLAELPIADLARACRQGLFPEDVVPVAVGRLREDPTAGDQYGGELLASLRGVPEGYWERRHNLRSELSAILASLEASGLDDELTADVKAIRKNVGLI